ncbi:MAG: NAD-dependent epimerase/dehydratase family protein [Myxococcales bacterium]|nr:NAD-dependent epimerase/dehydratase family protein [Myxococcales bacterium]
MSRFLVTGATTVVAEALIEHLLDDPRTELVLAVGREPRRAPPLEDGRVRYERVDLSREREVRSLVFGPVRELGVDRIVHMATHRRAIEGPRAHALNAQAARHVLHFAERVESVQRFVYRSYRAIYEDSAGLPARIGEDHPLRIGPRTPQYILDRVEADLAVCARMGMSRIRIAVLRCAECLAEGTGSQLWDYLQPKVCFRPLGFDPMINVISEDDLGRALALAARSDAEGIFTVPGYDTLPLSRIIARFGRREVAVPGPLLQPLYGLRRAALGGDFDYAINRGRLHFGGVLDGERAAEVLGYRPEQPVRWPLDLQEVERQARASNPRTLAGRFARWRDG